MHVLFFYVTPERGQAVLPLVDAASLVSQGYGDRAHLGEAEVLAVVMVVGGDPAHPDRRGVLSRKHPDRVVVLWRGRGRPLIEAQIKR